MVEFPTIPPYDGVMTDGQWLKWVALVVLALAGCGAQPTERFALGDTLMQEDFSSSFAWEEYVNLEQKVDFQLEDGMYRARAWDGGFMWAIKLPAHTDVVIEVETTQLSDYGNVAYGVMCRAAPTNNSDGYYFLIGGDGYYTIRRGSTDHIGALIPFTYSNTIRRGRSVNRIRAVCIGDYLALYVNGEFVAETRDDYFSRGYTGLAAGVVEGGDVDVAFDDLTVWEARLLP